jgi:hypothetical protein
MTRNKMKMMLPFEAFHRKLKFVITERYASIETKIICAGLATSITEIMGHYIPG